MSDAIDTNPEGEMMHLQTHYIVVRDGEEVIVPIKLLTRAELENLAAERLRLGAAKRQHADELRRYVEEMEEP